MKKLATLFSVLCLSFTMAFAEENPALNYDAQNVNDEFAQLNKIEQYVQQNEGVTLEELKRENNNLLENISLSNESAIVAEDASNLFGIPAFWWGCVIGIIGIILVYVLTDQDKDQTKKALIGCVVGWGGAILLSFLLSIAGVASIGFWGY